MPMGTATREADVEAAIVAKLRDLSPEKMRDVLEFVEALAQGHGRPPNGRPSADGDEALIARYIDTVNVDYDHPSYARLADYGTPVWAVVGAWKTTGDVEGTAREWGVPVEYVHAALAYYGRYRRYIDAMLALNESEPHEPERLRR
jgi:uncharacterized protein (DUF433 family)